MIFGRQRTVLWRTSVITGLITTGVIGSIAAIGDSVKLVLFVLLTGDIPFEAEDVVRREAPERAAEAIASFEEQMAQEGRSIPLALLTGLLQPDPSLRVDAAQALQDAWLELAPDLPAAQSYATGVKKSRESTRRQRTLMQPY